jgi:hypothetical protein
VREVAPGIWRWTAPHPEWRTSHEWGHEVASFALELPDLLLLVDPLAPPDAEPFWAALDRLRGRRAVAVLITVGYHVRSSAEVHARYRDVSVWGVAGARRRLTPRVPTELIEPGTPLPGGAQAFAVGKPRRDEMPLYFPSHRALAFGDTVVGVDAEIRVWDSPSRGDTPWYRDRFLPTLLPLLELDIDHVLVTHGPPAIGDGQATLQRGLASPPWHRPGD